MNKRIVISLLLATLLTDVYAEIPAMPPVAVKTEVIQPIVWQHKIAMTGKLLAHQGIVVKSESAGRITELYFHSGQIIRAGSPLVQLNDSSLQAQKKVIELELSLSEKDLQRKTDLYPKQAISKAEYESAETKVKADQAKLEQINAQLQQMSIKAPFSGKLGLSKISTGDYLIPGQEIVNLQATNPILVNFDVPESIISQLKTGQHVIVESSANPSKPYKGTVTALETLINPGTQSLTVQAVLENPNNELIPGTFVSVVLLVGDQQQVLMVPQTSIIYGADGTFVYTTDGNQAHKTKVQLGERTDKNVVVKSGLSAGQKIVTVGNMKLYDGANITNITDGVQHG